MDDHASPRLPPILLVDGFTPIRVPYAHIRRFYQKHGRVVRLVPYRSADMHDVVAYAHHIVEEACRLLDDENTTRIDIMGYSMGGVAVLYAMKRLGLAPYVRTFLAYCTPFHGSWLSRLARPAGLYTKMGAQLLPESLFLSELHADPLPEGPRYISIHGTRDILCRPHQCILEGAKNAQISSGHWTFYWHRGIHKKLLPHLA